MCNTRLSHGYNKAKNRAEEAKDQSGQLEKAQILAFH